MLGGSKRPTRPFPDPTSRHNAVIRQAQVDLGRGKAPVVEQVLLDRLLKRNRGCHPFCPGEHHRQRRLVDSSYTRNGAYDLVFLERKAEGS